MGGVFSPTHKLRIGWWLAYSLYIPFMLAYILDFLPYLKDVTAHITDETMRNDAISISILIYIVLVVAVPWVLIWCAKTFLKAKDSKPREQKD